MNSTVRSALGLGSTLNSPVQGPAPSLGGTWRGGGASSQTPELWGASTRRQLREMSRSANRSILLQQSRAGDRSPTGTSGPDSEVQRLQAELQLRSEEVLQAAEIGRGLLIELERARAALVQAEEGENNALDEFDAIAVDRDALQTTCTQLRGDVTELTARLDAAEEEIVSLSQTVHRLREREAELRHEYLADAAFEHAELTRRLRTAESQMLQTQRSELEAAETSDRTAITVAASEMVCGAALAVANACRSASPPMVLPSFGVRGDADADAAAAMRDAAAMQGVQTEAALGRGAIQAEAWQEAMEIAQQSRRHCCALLVSAADELSAARRGNSRRIHALAEAAAAAKLSSQPRIRFGGDASAALAKAREAVQRLAASCQQAPLSGSPSPVPPPAPLPTRAYPGEAVAAPPRPTAPAAPTDPAATEANADAAPLRSAAPEAPADSAPLPQTAPQPSRRGGRRWCADGSEEDSFDSL
eukprot:TRINITY_DN25926_c0_g1_i2.p1 TRINITY_DN25926_c0_g1~~TRINITY_DN25926_c0_g1_i2.p1  ORF type:complete len:476 (+),score=147.36 TRINITY_DN25926_c0_g1_i2:531-1958(+)